MKKSTVLGILTLVTLTLAGCGNKNTNSESNRDKKIDSTVKVVQKSYSKEDKAKVAYNKKVDAITITPETATFKTALEQLNNGNGDEASWASYKQTMTKLSKQVSKSVDSKISLIVVNPENSKKQLLDIRNGKTVYNFHKTSAPASDEYSFKNNVFKTDKLSFAITKSAIIDGVGGNGKALALYVNITNNTKSDVDLLSNTPYTYIHAYQKTDSAKKMLQPGTLNVGAAEQTLVSNMKDSVLPGKTVQGIITWQLETNSDIQVTFMDSGFNVIKSKDFSVN